MKVAMVSEHASPLAAIGGVDAGGQNVHVAALALALGEMGVDVVVHTRRDQATLPDRVRLADGVSVDHVPAGPAEPMSKDELLPLMDGFAEHLYRCWREDRPDVVHGHFWMSGHACLLAARRLRIPVVQTFHALGVVKRRFQGSRDTSPPERAEVERGVVTGVDHIIATCSDEVVELMRLGAGRDRISTVPCGVDLGHFRPDGPAEPRRAGRRRMLYVGRMVERKGVADVVCALAQMPDNTELVIAGGPPRERLADDPEAMRILRLARRNRVEDRVELRGRVDRDAVPALLRSADLIVTTPWYEPFGIVPLEAMACGVPVVGSAVGGMLDSIEDGVTGVLVPPRDPRRLAEVANELLGDPGRRRRMGAAGVERARRLYDWRQIATGTLAAYRRVLAERSAPLIEVGGNGNGKPALAVEVAVATNGSGNGNGRHPGRNRAGRQRCGRHLSDLGKALAGLEEHSEQLDRWGSELAERLTAGARLLAVGNGGSAAEAQHLTAELVGRYRDERRPLSAISLHAETSSLTAITNDYGADEAIARQVLAHGRPGDVLIALSTSGRSNNVIAAVEAANAAGIATWALTGPGPNPLAAACDESVCLPGPAATVQELHLIAVHMICEALDVRCSELHGAGPKVAIA